jgi:hypothetical protein
MRNRWPTEAEITTEAEIEHDVVSGDSRRTEHRRVSRCPSRC